MCCSLLNLPSVVNPVNVCQIPQQLGKPSKLYKTKGDGNCLFRAISFSISGRQVYHQIVRNKIVEHMIAIESALRPHMNSSLDNYLARSGMKNQNVWGTDIEILTASSLLQTDIFVYTKIGSGYKWQKFSRSMLNEHVPQNKGALYLQNTAGVHYDVVVQVCSNIADISYTCCENSTFKSAVNSNENKQKHTFIHSNQDSKLLNDLKTHIQADNFNDNVHKKDNNYKKCASASSKKFKDIPKKSDNASASSKKFKEIPKKPDNSCQSNQSSKLVNKDKLHNSSTVDINVKNIYQTSKSLCSLLCINAKHV